MCRRLWPSCSRAASAPPDELRQVLSVVVGKSRLPRSWPQGAAGGPRGRGRESRPGAKEGNDGWTACWTAFDARGCWGSRGRRGRAPCDRRVGEHSWRDEGSGGGWLITRRDKGSSSTVLSTVTFADGGALATADINPPTPGTALGSWEDEANQHFSATFWTGSPNPDGSVAVIRVRPQGRWWDDHIEGSYSVDLLVKGKLVPVGSGTFHGNRIEP